MELIIDGTTVTVDDPGSSLLDVLRVVGAPGVKDGCSPQGQCGCCTVLIDGVPRVSCVTPVRRVAGRAVTTVDGLEPAVRARLIRAFVDAGASQCGFCTPGILVRLASLAPGAGAAEVETALLAHLCRCTGWRTVVDAGVAALTDGPTGPAAPARDLVSAGRQATLEGGAAQAVGPDVVVGRGGFAVDSAPPGALVAVPDGRGDWSVAPSLQAARAGTVQGRRSGRALSWPVELPAGDWVVTLRTTWVEPAYLEPDTSWCVPGGTPAPATGNGGAFGGKQSSPAPAAARMLADRHGVPVVVHLLREDVVRLGPKRPPVAGGIAADGRGVLRVAGGPDPGLVAAVAAVAPGLVVESRPVTGPPTSADLRAAGWAEAAVLVAGLDARLRSVDGTGAASVTVRAPGGGRARAEASVTADGRPERVAVTVDGGAVLDEVVARSYAVGAAHMALGWVCSEGLAIDAEGVPEDLTVRSWGVLRARDTPPVTVDVVDRPDRPAVNGSDAVLAAVAAATWIAQGLPPAWPTIRERYP